MSSASFTKDLPISRGTTSKALQRDPANIPHTNRR